MLLLYRKFQSGKNDISVSDTNEQGDSGVVIQNPMLVGAAKQKRGNAFAFESLLNVLESPPNRSLSQSVQAMPHNFERSIQDVSGLKKGVPCTKHMTDETVDLKDDIGASDDYDDVVIQSSPAKNNSVAVMLPSPERGSNPPFFLDGKNKLVH